MLLISNSALVNAMTWGLGLQHRTQTGRRKIKIGAQKWRAEQLNNSEQLGGTTKIAKEGSSSALRLQGSSGFTGKGKTAKFAETLRLCQTAAGQSK